MAAEMTETEVIKAGPPKKSRSVYGFVLLLCFVLALSLLGYQVYGFFRSPGRAVIDPVNITVTPEGVNVAGTMKLGDAEIPFSKVFADDTDGDGYLDRRSYYLEDMLVLAAWDTDSNDDYDLWLRFVDGDYVDLEAYDMNGDGLIDKLVSVDQNEVVTGVEQLSEKETGIVEAMQAVGSYVLPVLFFLILLSRYRRRRSR